MMSPEAITALISATAVPRTYHVPHVHQQASRLALAGLIVIASGCGSDRHLRISADDVTVLQRVDEESDWSFVRSRSSVELRPDGVAVLDIEGRAAPKAGSAGDLWVPLLLVQDLPEYYRLEGAPNGPQPQLEAYKLTSGLWHLTGVLPEDQAPRASSSDPAPATQALSTAVTFRLTIFSPSYTRRLPLLLPTSAGHGSLDFRVVLPSGSRFQTTDVEGQSAEGTTRSQLTVLPASLAGTQVTAAAALRSAGRTAWDLTAVTYSLQAPPSFRPWFLPVALLVMVAGTGVALSAVTRRRRRREAHERREARQHRLRMIGELAADVQAALEHVVQSRDSGQFQDELDRISHGWDVARNSVGGLNTSSLLVGGMDARLELYDLTRLVQSVVADRPPGRTDEWRVLLEKLKHLTAILDQTDSFRRSPYAEPEWARVVRLVRRHSPLILTLAAIALIVWLLAIAAAARGAQLPAAPPRGSRTVLGELSVGVAPDYGREQGNDMVAMTVGFTALTDSRSAKHADIVIDVGRDGLRRVSDVALPAHSIAKVSPQSATSITVTTPVTYWQPAKHLAALAGRLEAFNIGKYEEVMASAPRTTVTYSVSGTREDRAWNKDRSFHWFPFDRFSFSVPVRFDHVSLVSDVSLQRPGVEWRTTPWVHGPVLTLTQQEHGARYYYRSPPGKPSPLQARTPLRLDATFRRWDPQSWGLTLGLLLASVIVGWILGWVSTWGEKDWRAGLVAALGIVGVPWAVRSAVLATYPALPNSAAITALTLFDTCFWIGVVLMALTAWRARAALSTAQP